MSYNDEMVEGRGEEKGRENEKAGERATTNFHPMIVFLFGRYG